MSVRRSLIFTVALLLAVVVRAADQVNLLAIGDWGADNSVQAAVASAMASYVERNQIKLDAVLLLGDNFYVKLSGVDDPQWNTLFEQMYDPKRLAVPFYAALGNHDYKDGKAPIELDRAKQNQKSRFKLPARWYRVDLPPVILLALDSNRKELSEAQWTEQTKWLKTELSKPHAGRWTICFAHHPLFSDSVHGDDATLQSDWGPAFKRHKTDFYLCGHDHCLEHLQIPGWPTSFIVSGGGGQSRYEIERENRAKFARSDYGFVHLQFTADKARVNFLDRDGKSLHVFERDHTGNVKIVSQPE